MTFQELSDHIQEKRRSDYANLLLVHSQAIISEVGKTTKQEVAPRLKMSPQTFSLVYQLILAHNGIIEEIELNHEYDAIDEYEIKEDYNVDSWAE